MGSARVGWDEPANPTALCRMLQRVYSLIGTPYVPTRKGHTLTAAWILANGNGAK